MNMMRHTVVVLMLCVVASLTAQEKKLSTYAIGFYNQENLFDTCHDEGKNDYDFLPTGSFHWTAEKYSSKLENMARVLAEMGTDRLQQGCAFIGLAEVENARCLDDLCAQKPLADRNMQYVLFEGVDQRGIDVACLYNPSLFTIDKERTSLVPYETTDTTLLTRGFLVVHGMMGGEHICCIVCHLPSRRGSEADDGRYNGALQITNLKQQILADDPLTKIFIMGDMNDDPIDRSMVEGLRGKETIAEVTDDDLFNPWLSVIKSGYGTLYYRGAWNLFDQILLSPNLLQPVPDAVPVKNDWSSLKYFYSHVFCRDYLFQTDGRYAGSPKRTHAGGRWLNGYSDHLPVVVYLQKME